MKERFKEHNLKEIIDHKVIEFASYVSGNRSDGGKWIETANDSVLAHSMDKLNVVTTRIS